MQLAMIRNTHKDRPQRHSAEKHEDKRYNGDFFGRAGKSGGHRIRGHINGWPLLVISRERDEHSIPVGSGGVVNGRIVLGHYRESVRAAHRGFVTHQIAAQTGK